MKIKSLAFLLSLIMLTVCCSCGKTTQNGKVVNKDTNQIINWVKTANNAVLENTNYKLEVSAETGELTVLDKAHNAVYSSRAMANDNQDNIALSELSLVYYDSQSVEYTMNTYENSVQLKTFELFNSDNAIKIKYSFSKDTENFFVPKIFDSEVFDEILESLDSSEAFSLKRNYQLLKTSSSANNIKAYKEEYSYLKKHDIYIVYDNITSSEKKSITKLMEKVGYTQEKYLEDTERMDVDSSQLDLSAAFDISLQFSLTDGGFNVTCPVEEIKNKNENYVLNQLYLLPGFSIVGDTDNLSVVLADGSGSVLNLADKPDQTYSSRIYGANEVIESERELAPTQSYRLPVYGVSSNTGSYLSVVSSAEASALVKVSAKGTTNKSNMICTVFNYEEKDNITIRPGSNLAVLNYYSGKKLEVNPAVTYIFSDKNLNDIQLAGMYNEYLKSNEFLSNNATGRTLLLEFTGYTTLTTQFAGISGKKVVVLSTLSDIEKILKQLYDAGIEGIDVRLTSFGNGGMKNGVASNFDIYKGVGTKKQLLNLADLIAKNGGKLYLENDVSYCSVDNLGDGFSKNKDVSKTLDGSIAYSMMYNPVNLNYEKPFNTKYIVSPNKYLEYFTKFGKELNDEIDSDNISVSWKSGGKLLQSDYRSSNVLDREDGLCYTEEAFKYLNEKFGVITNGGNQYSFKYSDFIADIPLYSSQKTIESQNSMFYQAAIHGSIDYFGESISTSLFPDNLVLRSVETGASLYYSFTTVKDAYTKLDFASNMLLLPPVADSYIDEIKQNCKSLSAFYSAVKEAQIISHSSIAKDVYRTDYSNGAYSIVNYAKTDFVLNDITINPNDYYVSEVA